MTDSDSPRGLPPITPGAIMRMTLGAAVAFALLGWVLPAVTRTSWGEIFAVLAGVPAWALALCFLLALGFLFAYAIVLKASLPGLSTLRAVILNTAGTAISKLFPGGGAVGLAATFVLCRSWGFTMKAISTSAIVTGVWNTLTRISLPVFAIALLAWSDITLPGVLRQAAVGAAVTGALVLVAFIGIMASDRVADRFGVYVDWMAERVFRRRGRTGRARAAMTETREKIIERVRSAWHWMTLGMVGFFAAQFGIFLIALHVTGISLAFAGAFAAFAIGRLLTAVGITPGGIGITETGTAAALVALGANPAEAGAAVVLMSIFTNVIELPLGVLAWIAWTLDRAGVPVERIPVAAAVTSDDEPHSGSTEPPESAEGADPADPDRGQDPSRRRT